VSRSEDEEIARALSRERSAIMPRAWLKLVYSLTLIAMVFPLGVAGMSGWVGLTLGTSLLGPFLLPLLAVVGWRFYVVWRHPTTLMRHRAGAVIAFLRGVAVIEMTLGCLAALALLLQRPIIAAMGGVRTESGIEYYLLQLGAVMVGGLGLQGLLIFEWSRIIGMERFYREDASTEIPERESQWVLWVTVLALVVLLAQQVAAAVYLLGSSGAATPALAGLAVALPLTLTIVLRVVSLLAHRREIPQPVAGGVLGAVRKLAMVGLAVALLAGMLVVGQSIVGLAGRGGGGFLSYAVFPMLLGLPLLAALEATRLLGFERHERRTASPV